MAKTYGVVMNKGGVGKTTIITYLAMSLGLKHKVLIVDADAQGNASIALDINPNKLKKTIYDCLINKVNPEEVLIKVNENVDLLPSNESMNYFEIDVLNGREKPYRPLEMMKCMISDIIRNYEYVLIDAPPSLGMVTGNVLKAVDEVFIPFVPERFSVQGLIRIISTIRQAKNVEIAGVIATMVDRRTKIHSDFVEQAREYCNKNNIRMLETVIPRKIEFTKDNINPYNHYFHQIIKEGILCKKETCLMI